MVLMRMKCILQHYTRIQPQQLIRHKLSEDDFCRKKTKKLNNLTHAWDKVTIGDLEKDYPKQDYGLFLIVVVRDNFASNNINLLIKYSAYKLDYSMMILKINMDFFYQI